MTVILELKETLDIPIEADCITPNHFAGKTVSQIGNLSIHHGNQTLILKEFFKITGKAGKTPADTEIVVQGDLRKVKMIGKSMDGGKITVEGNAGMYMFTCASAGTLYSGSDFKLIYTQDPATSKTWWARGDLESGGMKELFDNLREEIDPCYAPCDPMIGWHCDDGDDPCSCDMSTPFVEGDDPIANGTCIVDPTPTPCDGPCNDDSDCKELDPGCACNFNIQNPDHRGTCTWEIADPCYAPCMDVRDCPVFPDGPECFCNTEHPFDDDSIIHTLGTCEQRDIVPEFPLTTIPLGLSLIAYGIARRKH